MPGRGARDASIAIAYFSAQSKEESGRDAIGSVAGFYPASCGFESRRPDQRRNDGDHKGAGDADQSTTDVAVEELDIRTIVAG